MTKKLPAVIEVTVFIGLLMMVAHWSVPRIAGRFGGGMANIYIGLLWGSLHFSTFF